MLDWFTHLALSLLFGLADRGTNLGQFLPSCANLLFLSAAVFLWNSRAVGSAFNRDLSSDCGASLARWRALLFVHHGTDGLGGVGTLGNRGQI